MAKRKVQEAIVHGQNVQRHSGSGVHAASGQQLLLTQTEPAPRSAAPQPPPPHSHRHRQTRSLQHSAENTRVKRRLSATPSQEARAWHSCWAARPITCSARPHPTPPPCQAWQFCLLTWAGHLLRPRSGAQDEVERVQQWVRDGLQAEVGGGAGGGWAATAGSPRIANVARQATSPAQHVGAPRPHNLHAPPLLTVTHTHARWLAALTGSLICTSVTSCW